MAKFNFKEFNTSNQNRLLLMPILILIVCAILFSLLTVPAIKKVLQARNDTISEQANLKKLTEKLNDLMATADSDYLDMSQKVLSAVPSYNHYYEQLTAIKATAIASGLVLTSVETSPGLVEEETEKKKDDNVQRLVVKLGFSGLYGQIKDFTDKIENSLPLSEVTELDIESSVSSLSGTMNTPMEAKMQIISYWSPLPKFLPKIDAPIKRLDKTESQIVDQISQLQQLPQPFVSSDYVDQQIISRDNPFPY